VKVTFLAKFPPAGNTIPFSSPSTSNLGLKRGVNKRLTTDFIQSFLCPIDLACREEIQIMIGQYLNDIDVLWSEGKNKLIAIRPKM